MDILTKIGDTMTILSDKNKYLIIRLVKNYGWTIEAVLNDYKLKKMELLKIIRNNQTPNKGKIHGNIITTIKKGKTRRK